MSIRVGDIGEFALIEKLLAVLPAEVVTGSGLVAGIGDDTAVWRPPKGEHLLITTDAMVEGVHFDLGWTDWFSLGYKALAVNVSDIASMGGVPAVALITLGLQADRTVDDLVECYRGLGAMAKTAGVVIAGGDIVSSPNAFSISVTLIGITVGGRYLSRSGARAGDEIAVSGTLGAAAGGLKLGQLPEQDPRRSAATAGLLIEALLRPQPRVELGQRLIELGATSAMDLSDGLLGDLPKILQSSDVDALLFAGSIPYPASLRALFPDSYLDMAMRGGEDYELIFTASPTVMPAIREAAEILGQSVTTIGTIQLKSDSKSRMRLQTASGDVTELAAGAFDHFR
ncbi:thiamine-phosphate kinase [soil metagenome]